MLRKKEKKRIPPTIALQKKKKSQRTNLSKKVKDLYNRKFKTLKKDIEEEPEDGKNSHINGLAELN